MTIADQTLTVAQDVLAGARMSSACFSETGADAPRELRLHYSGYEQSDGVIAARDGEGVRLFAADMRQFAAAVPCFTLQTDIATGAGLSPVADLRVGQRVSTRDNGLQTIRWIGRRRFGWRALALNPFLRPVRIAAGALGSGLPERDMIVSPNHRFLIALPGEGESGERLVPARDLVGLDGIAADDATEVEYVQILCDRHELLLGDGCWSESFQPAAAALAVLPEADRAVLLAVLGGDAAAPDGSDYTQVRPSRQETAA